MPSLLTRHLLAESYRLAAAVSGILVLVYLSNQLARYLAEVAEGQLDGDLLLSLLLLKLASVLVLLLPAAFFLALLLTLGRMYSDSEMVALAACGYGPGQLLRAVLLAALPVALLTAFLAFDAGPTAANLATRVLEQARARAVTSAIIPGQFTEVGDGLVYHVQGIDADGEMRGLFGYMQRRDGTLLLNATTARIERDPVSGRQDLVMRDGTRYDGTPGEGDFRVFEFERYRLHLPGGSAATPRWRLEGVPTSELLGTADRRRLAELHWRLALPLSVLVLAFIAVPVSHSPPRQGRYARLMLALLAYVVYVNLLGAGRTLLGGGKLPSELGLWWAHLPLLLLGWALLRRQLGRSWWPGRRPVPA